MHHLTTLALTLLPHLVTAHFSIVYPQPRGTENEENMINYPCGGYPTVSTTRRTFPLTGAPITINNEHTESRVSAVLALGSNPGPGDFVYQLVPTVETEGPREFCMGSVDVLGALMRAGVMQSAEELQGMNATILVSTDSHAEDEGLYNCADITLTTTPLSSSSYTTNCRNSTGVTATVLSDGSVVNANGTAVGGGSSSESSDSGSSAGSGSDGSGGDSMGGGSNGAASGRGELVGGVVVGLVVVCAMGLL